MSRWKLWSKVRINGWVTPIYPIYKYSKVYNPFTDHLLNSWQIQVEGCWLSVGTTNSWAVVDWWCEFWNGRWFKKRRVSVLACFVCSCFYLFLIVFAVFILNITKSYWQLESLEYSSWKMGYIWDCQYNLQTMLREKNQLTSWRF